MNANAVMGQSSIQESATEGCISERRLWTAVIVMAVQDWNSGTLRARREAQTFLFEDKSDFEDVCGSAGLDPDSLRSRLLKIGKKVEMQGPYLSSSRCVIDASQRGTGDFLHCTHVRH